MSIPSSSFLFLNLASQPLEALKFSLISCSVLSAKLSLILKYKNFAFFWTFEYPSGAPFCIKLKIQDNKCFSMCSIVRVLAKTPLVFLKLVVAALALIFSFFLQIVRTVDSAISLNNAIFENLIPFSCNFMMSSFSASVTVLCVFLIAGITSCKKFPSSRLGSIISCFVRESPKDVEGKNILFSSAKSVEISFWALFLFLKFANQPLEARKFSLISFSVLSSKLSLIWIKILLASVWILDCSGGVPCCSWSKIQADKSFSVSSMVRVLVWRILLELW